MEGIKVTEPKRYTIARNFKNLIGKRFLRDIYGNPKKIGIVRSNLSLRISTIIKVNSLLVFFLL